MRRTRQIGAGALIVALVTVGLWIVGPRTINEGLQPRQPPACLQAQDLDIRARCHQRLRCPVVQAAPAVRSERRARERQRLGRFQVGLGMRVWEDNDVKAATLLRPRLVRFEVPSSEPEKADRWLRCYASLGALPQPLVGFENVPSTATLDRIAAWAIAQKSKFRLLEFGNENYIRQPDQGGAYAQAVRYLAQKLAGSGIGILAQGDDNNTGSSWWIDAMYASVPNLHDYVAGWTIHPYGPPSLTRLNRVSGFLARYGGDKVKFYVTEFGIASDGGRTLSDNFAYPVNMTYAAAGAELRKSVAGFRDSGRVAQVMLYQSTDQQPSGSSNNREGFFGLVQADGLTRKGDYTQAGIDLLAAG